MVGVETNHDCRNPIMIVIIHNKRSVGMPVIN